jgi:cyclic nucleotide-binding protein
MVLDWLGRRASVDVLIAKRKYDKAIGQLREELAGGRSDPRLRLQLADVLVLAGKQDEAVPVLLTLADGFARDGFAAKAISVLKKVEKLDPGRRDVDISLASLIKEKQREQRRIGAPVGSDVEEPHPVDQGGEPAPAPAPEPAAAAPAEGPHVVSLSEEILISIEDALTEAARQEDEATVGAGQRGAGPKRLQSPLFDDFTEDELLAVIRGLTLLTFEPGDVIVGSGDAGDSLFVLTTGTAKAFVRDVAGHHVFAREMREGAFFGEISILTGSPRTATVTARSRCDVLELDRESLDRISQAHPRVRDVLQAFCQHRLASDEFLTRRGEDA